MTRSSSWIVAPLGTTIFRLDTGERLARYWRRHRVAVIVAGVATIA